jgi:hypothetical protein
MSADMTEDWAKQLTVEYIDDKTGYWVCPEGADNHAWDVSVYGLVAHDVLGVKYWSNDEEIAPEGPVSVENKPKKQQRSSKW